MSLTASLEKALALYLKIILGKPHYLQVEQLLPIAPPQGLPPTVLLGPQQDTECPLTRQSSLQETLLSLHGHLMKPWPPLLWWLELETNSPPSDS